MIKFKPAPAVGSCKFSSWTATLMDVHASDQLGVGRYCQNSLKNRQIFCCNTQTKICLLLVVISISCALNGKRKNRFLANLYCFVFSSCSYFVSMTIRVTLDVGVTSLFIGWCLVSNFKTGVSFLCTVAAQYDAENKAFNSFIVCHFYPSKAWKLD